MEGYLYVPSGVTAEIDLNDHIIDRGLTEASSTGFVIRNDGTLTIVDGCDNSGKITGGYAERGGVWISKSLMLDNTVINNNKASAEGGAVYFKDGPLTVADCTFNNNTSNDGGAVFFESDATAFRAMNTDFIGNKSTENGGGVHVSGAAMMNVSGDIVIKNNYLDTNGSASANNVRITDSAYIKKVGELTSDTEIYINPKIYNHALVMSITEDDMKYFIFDDPTTVARSGLQKTYINGKMYVLAGYDAKKRSANRSKAAFWTARQSDSDRTVHGRRSPSIRTAAADLRCTCIS